MVDVSKIKDFLGTQLGSFGITVSYYGYDEASTTVDDLYDEEETVVSYDDAVTFKGKAFVTPSEDAIKTFGVTEDADILILTTKQLLTAAGISSVDRRGKLAVSGQEYAISNVKPLGQWGEEFILVLISGTKRD